MSRGEERGIVTIEGAEDDLPSPPSLGGWLMNLVDAATASHRRAIALLVALAVLCFAPGFFSLPPVDRDEARFAQATKQMLEAITSISGSRLRPAIKSRSASTGCRPAW